VPAPSLSGSAALAWARQLLAVHDVHGLLQVALELLRERTRYRHGWLGMLDASESTLLFLSGIGQASLDRIADAELIEMSVDGDRMVEELLTTMKPVVVADARHDPRPNPDAVAAMGNRTIVSLPLYVDDHKLGFLGVGTFGDEGPIPPTEEELDLLQLMASHLSVVLARLRAEERRVAAEEQLHAAQRLEAMGRIAGGVAHDMNNLLTVELGNVDLARLATDPASAAHSIDDIEAAATRAAALSRQLLSFSRRRVLQVQPVDMRDVVQNMAPLFGRLLTSDIQLEVLEPAHPLVVRGDSGQLEQVVMNLVVNARDAMADTGGRLAVELEAVELEGGAVGPPGPYAVVAVSDTGIGMPPEVQARIFEPFFTTKGPEAGTGLGLSVVHGIVDQHDGQLRVYSEPGYGTTMRVYLPLAEEDAIAPGAVVVAPAPKGGHERILVADDDQQVRHVLHTLLGEAGYQVEEARDGAEAIDIVRSGAAIDLLISDVVMPRMGGMALIDALAQEGLELPTLVISGYAASGVARQLAANDRRRVLSKPFRRTELLGVVRALLDGVAGPGQG